MAERAVWHKGNPNERLSHLPTTGQPVVDGYYPDIPMNAGDGGALRRRNVITNPHTVSPYRTSFTENDTLIQVDRHPFMTSGGAQQPGEGDRRSGIHDQAADGPTRASVLMMNRTWYPWAGFGASRFLDNTEVQFSPYGQQDGVSWTQVRSFEKQYNADGTEKSSVVRIPPSGPHGTHTRPLVNQKAAQNAGRMAKPSQQNPRQNRLANSNVAGQSFSATTQHVGATQGQGSSRHSAEPNSGGRYGR